MGAVALDASVVIAEADHRDAHHRAAYRAVNAVNARGGSFCLPTSVVAEVLVSEVRRAGLAVGRQRLAWITQVFGPSRILDNEVALKAAELRAKHRWLRLPDALVLATALVDDVDAVLTADSRWTKVDKRVQVI